MGRKVPRMSELEAGRQPGGQHMMTLRGELASRRVTCDLRDGGGQRRLPVWYPGASTADEPFDRVAGAFARGEWWCCWPEITPISPVAPVSRAAEATISELRFGHNREIRGHLDMCGSPIRGLVTMPPWP
jgi:hypothetical protein